MKKVLCLYAHPNPKGSRANRLILERIGSLPGLRLHSLYDEYPEFHIDIDREQALLREHDVVLLQHPFYWYSMPPLLKLWLDVVLEFNYAYGPEGKALQGKDLLLSLTTGGPADSYGPGGYNRFPIQAFFPPYEQTARLCNMRWHDPMVLHHASDASQELLEQHAEKLRERLFDLMEAP